MYVTYSFVSNKEMINGTEYGDIRHVMEFLILRKLYTTLK
jgi:hypothetical protein